MVKENKIRAFASIGIHNYTTDIGLLKMFDSKRFVFM